MRMESLFLDGVAKNDNVDAYCRKGSVGQEVPFA